MTELRAIRTLKKDAIAIVKDPIPFIVTKPDPKTFLEWHFCIFGPEDTPYENGIYHGKLIFPKTYPMAAPDVYFLTPSGRFKTNKAICLSASAHHPDEWSASWTLGTLLTGLLSCT